MNKQDFKNYGAKKVSMPSILVIEDDKFLGELIIQKLKNEGFEAALIIDAKEVAKFIEEKKPCLILLDLVLPGLDGFAFLAQMKSRSQTADIPVVILSNVTQKEDMDKAISIGAADYLVKSNYTLGEIVGKIREILRKK